MAESDAVQGSCDAAVVVSAVIVVLWAVAALAGITRKLHCSIDELQADFDAWTREYNPVRIH